MLRPVHRARQAAINAICSYFVSFRVDSTHKLSQVWNQILEKINNDPNVFHHSDSSIERIEIFKSAVAAYANITECNIRIPAECDWKLLTVMDMQQQPLKLLAIKSEEAKTSIPRVQSSIKMSSALSGLTTKSFDQKKNVSASSSVSTAVSAASASAADSASIPTSALIITKETDTNSDKQSMEDLSRVTHSYDQLVTATQRNKNISLALTKVFEDQKASLTCDTIILGAGDTGTTLWIEKYKQHHQKTHEAVSKKTLPPVVIIADGFGSWKHDYTLAQTQSSLERSHADINPRDFLPTDFYELNPQANARHVFQANQVCLGRSEAPLLTAIVLKIESKSKHPIGWNNGHPYRIRINLPTLNQIKEIYFQHIEICTGLGAPNFSFYPTVISAKEATQLNQFDSKLGFTPIVDGNQFVLTGTEEVNCGRSIVIYGGGGTACAVYRKSFFGSDVRTYDLPYTKELQKNQVKWVYKDFIGTGKMADNAKSAALARKEIFRAELVKITPAKGKLVLSFKMLDEKNIPTTSLSTVSTAASAAASSSTADSLQLPASTMKLECDQLIYSIGQNDIRTKDVCSEVASDLKVNTDANGMLLFVESQDQRVRFFGASAVTVCKNEFIGQTTKWLDAQNIGGDVGPGSMPPTRAQIKRHLHLLGVNPVSVNLNMDSTPLIEDFLKKNSATAQKVVGFMSDLLMARKHDTYGCSRIMIVDLLKKHDIFDLFDIFGHSHLVVKGKLPTTSPKHLSTFSFLTPAKALIQRAVTEGQTQSDTVRPYSLNPSLWES